MFDIKPQFHNILNENPTHNSNHRYMNKGGDSGSGHRCVQFRPETTSEELEVGSPTLWAPISPPQSPVRFLNSGEISPASRARAIARAQQELRDMVEEMPETSYELTLKDIVEQRREFRQSMEEGEERQRWWKNKNGSVKRQKSNNTRRVMVSNASLNNKKGLLINMFFPSLIVSKKKPGVRFSSKPKTLDQSGGGKGANDGDQMYWWGKKFTGSGDRESIGIISSSSGGSTGRSGSSGSSGSNTSTASSVQNDHNIRKESDYSHGCSSFFSSKKKKKKKKQ